MDKLLVGGAVEKVVPLCVWKIEHLVLGLWKAGRWTLRLAVGPIQWFNKSCGAEARSRDLSHYTLRHDRLADDTLTRGLSNESSVN